MIANAIVTRDIGSSNYRIDSLSAEILTKINSMVLVFIAHMVPACTAGDFVMGWEADAVTERLEGTWSRESWVGRLLNLLIIIKILVIFHIL